MPLMRIITKRSTVTSFPAVTQTWASADYFLDIHNIYDESVLGNGNFATTEADVQTPAISSGRFVKLKIKVISGTLTSSITFNTRINGVDSSQTMTISSMSAATYNLTPTETFSENDLLSIRANSADNGGTHNIKFSFACEIQYDE